MEACCIQRAAFNKQKFATVRLFSQKYAMCNLSCTRKVPLGDARSRTYLAGVGLMFTMDEFIIAV
ncbi:MAG: hypothetical protein DCF22_18745, partial [Leptolyngbya sp.]